MRKRNIKINVFLNEDEKKMLEEKSDKAKLPQSDFFRMLIQDYSEKKVLNKDIDEAINSLSNVSDNLSKFSNNLGRLCYYNFVDFLDEQITDIKKSPIKLKDKIT